MTVERPTEAALAAVAGGVLAGATGAVFGLAPVAAAVGAVNGALSGARGIYDWSASKGMVAFGLDSTWALPMTAGSLAAQAIGAVRGRAGYVAELSRRKNRHVYRRGFQPRRNFAITIGNSISGAGDVTRPRRAKLVTDHEDVHVWQARWFGPLYPVLYGGWMVAGGVYGGVRWLTGFRPAGFAKTVESYGYYVNPFEWWAYSRDDHWPPGGVVPEVAWRKPMVRSFAAAGRMSQPS